MTYGAILTGCGKSPDGDGESMSDRDSSSECCVTPLNNWLETIIEVLKCCLAHSEIFYPVIICECDKYNVGPKL